MGDVSAMRVPGLSDDEEDALNRNLRRLIHTRPANTKRSQLYDCKHAPRQRSAVVPDMYYRLGIMLGWSAKAVDGLTRRTQIEGFTWADGDLNALGYREFARDNFLLSEVTQALTDSALHGVSFLINTRGQDEEPTSLLHARDALSTTGTWNHRVRRLTDGMSVSRWSDDDDCRPDVFTLYLDGMTITAERDGSGWHVDHSEHGWGVPIEPLVYRPRPSRRYGQSRLTRAVMGLHLQAVRELIRLEGHMDVYSYPEFWLLGGSMADFKNADGTQKALWQVMLGRIKGLEDNPKKPDDLARPDVKQFPAASPEPHVKTLDLLSRAFARESSLPDSAVALEGLSNPTSADAYDASQYELIAEAEGAMSDWSTPLNRSVARGLAIQDGRDVVPDEWLGIEPVWLGAKFESKAAKADAGMKQLSAIPWLAETEVGLELLGLSRQQIDRAMAERQLSMGRDQLSQIIAAGRQGQDDAGSGS